MAKKPLRLVEAAKFVKASRQGPKGWFERLTPAQQDELMLTKKQWRGGVPEASAACFARWLVERCSEHGIKTCGVDRMREWLARD